MWVYPRGRVWIAQGDCYRNGIEVDAVFHPFAGALNGVWGQRDDLVDRWGVRGGVEPVERWDGASWMTTCTARPVIMLGRLAATEDALVDTRKSLTVGADELHALMKGVAPKWRRREPLATP